MGSVGWLERCGEVVVAGKTVKMAFACVAVGDSQAVAAAAVGAADFDGG